jgi:hypothetical protein
VNDKTQDDEQSDWEDEGGATTPEPKQKTPKGYEIPVPKRKDVDATLKKLVQPVKKKP